MSTDPTPEDSQPDPEQESPDAQAQQETESSSEQSPSSSEQDSTNEAASSEKKVAKVRIGSQRDPADKRLSPTVPKAVSVARTSETKITTKPEPQTTPPQTQPQTQSIPESEPSETSDPPVTESRDPIGTPGLTIDQLSTQWDQDIGDIDDISMDEVLGTKSEKEVVADEIALESKVTGTVNRIHNDDIFITLSGQHEGVVSLRTLKEEPDVGTQLEVLVNSYNATDGLYDLRVPGATISVSDWADIDEGAVVEATVTGSNTGGLECTVNAIRGFIPASQISRYRVENLDEYVGKKLSCVVTEANPQRRNLVLSHRAIMEREMAEKREQLLASLEVGSEHDGTVTKLMDFGAFVDIGGIEGLVHISKLSWDRVAHPSEVLEEGQKIKVIVDKIDADSGKIGLSYRDTMDDPWKEIETRYPVNAIVPGTVTRVANFGAFVKLEPGVEGLVHISELAHHRVHTVTSVVNEGDQIQVKVLSVDPDAQKLSLSLKETLAKPEPKVEETADEAEETPAPVKKKRTTPLKGGRSGSSGGEQFGLKW